MDLIINRVLLQHVKHTEAAMTNCLMRFPFLLIGPVVLAATDSRALK